MRCHHQLAKLFFGAFLFMLLACVTSGCEVIDRLQAWKNGELQKETNGLGQNIAPPALPNTQTTPTPAGNTASPQDTGGTASGASTSPAAEGMRQIVLYFTDAEQSKLFAEQREIVREEGLAKATIRELLKGPAPGSSLKAAIPEGTLLNGINIKEDGLCLVDFNAKLIYNLPNDEKAEQMTVYSIVNTLCQFAAVKEVQILVEGKTVETLAGFMDVSKPLVRKE